MPRVSASSALMPSGPTLPATKTSFPLHSLPREPRSRSVYLVRSIPETESFESHPVGAKCVGFNDPRARGDVGLMNFAHPLRLADAEFLETALQRDAVVEQHRAHRAVATDETTLEFVEEIHRLCA